MWSFLHGKSWLSQQVSCSTIIIMIIIIIIIINDNVYGAVLMTMVTARVHPVHRMSKMVLSLS